MAQGVKIINIVVFLVFLSSVNVAPHQIRKYEIKTDGMKTQELYINIITEEKTNGPRGLTLWLPRRQRLPKPQQKGCPPPHSSWAQRRLL